MYPALWSFYAEVPQEHPMDPSVTSERKWQEELLKSNLRPPFSSTAASVNLCPPVPPWDPKTACHTLSTSCQAANPQQWKHTDIRPSRVGFFERFHSVKQVALGVEDQSFERVQEVEWTVAELTWESTEEVAFKTKWRSKTSQTSLLAKWHCVALWEWRMM